MTATANRIYLAVTIGVLVAVSAILFLGLTGAGIVAPTAGGSAERAQVQAENDYLDGLGEDAPALWDMPYADGVDPDSALVNLGRTACASAAGGVSWPQVAGLMADRGFSTNDAFAVATNASRSLCPEA